MNIYTCIHVLNVFSLVDASIFCIKVFKCIFYSTNAISNNKQGWIEEVKWIQK